MIGSQPDPPERVQVRRWLVGEFNAHGRAGTRQLDVAGAHAETSELVVRKA